MIEGFCDILKSICILIASLPVDFVYGRFMHVTPGIVYSKS